MDKIRVSHLYRRTKHFFSIERVFAQLRPEMERGAEISSWTAPEGGFGLRTVIRNIRAARSVRADLYHITGDIHYLALGLPRDRTVLTIHDCVFMYSAKGAKRLLLKWLFLDWPVRHCALVTTISEATRRDILKFTGCAPDKVVVIPDPVDDGIFFSPRTFCNDEPVLLFIGITPNKNLSRVIPALEGIRCRMDIIGELPPEIKDLLDRHSIHYSSRSRLSDREMAEAYAGCDLVLFPSTFEGFGLPIIEAQKAGRPVLTSRLDPMQEVAGGAACLVDPYSISSIREEVVRLIGDQEYRDQLVRLGFDNVKRFDAGRIALQYLDCYRKVWKAHA